MRSTEQVVIISGAASGIGLELCRLFARRGASVGLIDRDKTELEEFSDKLLRAGARCASRSLMSASVSRCRVLFRKSLAHLGRLIF